MRTAPSSSDDSSILEVGRDPSSSLADASATAQDPVHPLAWAPAEAARRLDAAGPPPTPRSLLPASASSSPTRLLPGGFPSAISLPSLDESGSFPIGALETLVGRSVSATELPLGDPRDLGGFGLPPSALFAPAGPTAPALTPPSHPLSAEDPASSASPSHPPRLATPSPSPRFPRSASIEGSSLSSLRGLEALPQAAFRRATARGGKTGAGTAEQNPSSSASGSRASGLRRRSAVQGRSLKRSSAPGGQAASAAAPLRSAPFPRLRGLAVLSGEAEPDASGDPAASAASASRPRPSALSASSASRIAALRRAIRTDLDRLRRLPPASAYVRHRSRVLQRALELLGRDEEEREATEERELERLLGVLKL